jgi:hypothetical protein
MRQSNGYHRAGRASRKTPAAPNRAGAAGKGAMPAGEMVPTDAPGMPRGDMTSARASGPGPMPKGEMTGESTLGAMPKGRMGPAAQASRN